MPYRSELPLSEADWQQIACAFDLTPRLLEVLRHVMSGETAPEIARQLGITQATVRDHMRKLLQRTGSGDHVQLVLAVVRTHLDRLNQGIRRFPPESSTPK